MFGDGLKTGFIFTAKVEDTTQDPAVASGDKDVSVTEVDIITTEIYFVLVEGIVNIILTGKSQYGIFICQGDEPYNFYRIGFFRFFDNDIFHKLPSF
ncbi:hypothetical protein D3C80_1200590 [compost metagenome]